MGRVLALATSALLLSASTCQIKEDVSIPAAQAHDPTLVIGTVPQSGWGFIRVKAGSPVEEYFEIITNKVFKGEFRILGCEGIDFGGSIVGDNKPIKIKLSMTVPFEIWPERYDCEVQALAKLEFQVGDEIKRVNAISYIRITSLDPSYQPLPIDSPYGIIKTKYNGYEVQYSTQLRSAVKDACD